MDQNLLQDFLGVPINNHAKKLDLILKHKNELLGKWMTHQITGWQGGAPTEDIVLESNTVSIVADGLGVMYNIEELEITIEQKNIIFSSPKSDSVCSIHL